MLPRRYPDQVDLISILLDRVTDRSIALLLYITDEASHSPKGYCLAMKHLRRTRLCPRRSTRSCRWPNHPFCHRTGETAACWNAESYPTQHAMSDTSHFLDWLTGHQPISSSPSAAKRAGPTLEYARESPLPSALQTRLGVDSGLGSRLGGILVVRAGAFGL
jgi:hypothetical protein